VTRLPPRVVLAFDRYGRTVAVALVALGLLVAGTGAVGFEDANRTTVTDHVDRQTVTLNASSSATVTEPNPLFDRGTTLSDQAYPVAGAPNATVVVDTRTTDATELQYEHAVAIRYEITRGDDVVWSNVRTLATETGTVDGEHARSTVTVSIPSVRERLTELQSAAGGRASVSAALVVSSTYETGRYSGQFERTGALQIDDNWYQVPSLSARERRSTPEERTTVVPANNDATWLQCLLGTALIAVGVVAAVAKRRFEPGDQSALRRRVHQRRYDDWISNGHVPASFDRRVVTMTSLADLAELAIDRNRRIVFDESRRAYVVFDEDVVYYFDEFWTKQDADL